MLLVSAHAGRTRQGLQPLLSVPNGVSRRDDAWIPWCTVATRRPCVGAFPGDESPGYNAASLRDDRCATSTRTTSTTAASGGSGVPGPRPDFVPLLRRPRLAAGRRRGGSVAGGAGRGSSRRGTRFAGARSQLAGQHLQRRFARLRRSRLRPRRRPQRNRGPHRHRPRPAPRLQRPDRTPQPHRRRHRARRLAPERRPRRADEMGHPGWHGGAGGRVCGVRRKRLSRRRASPSHWKCASSPSSATAPVAARTRIIPAMVPRNMVDAG